MCMGLRQCPKLRCDSGSGDSRPVTFRQQPKTIQDRDVHVVDCSLLAKSKDFLHRTTASPCLR